MRGIIIIELPSRLGEVRMYTNSRWYTLLLLAEFSPLAVIDPTNTIYLLNEIII